MNEFDNSGPYCDPNAYIQRLDDNTKQSKKIIFQEPYECMPQYRMNNNLKKGDCDCVKCKEKKESKPGFDLKSLLPMLGSIGGDGFGGIMNLLNGNSNMSDLVSALSGNGGLSNLLKNFDISKFFGKTKSSKHEIKSSDVCIKDYKKID